MALVLPLLVAAGGAAGVALTAYFVIPTARRQRRWLPLAWVVFALWGEGLALWWAGSVWADARPYPVSREQAIGRYVYTREGRRDELELRADGRFTRRANYEGKPRTQTGRWTWHQEPGQHAGVELIDMEPEAIGGPLQINLRGPDWLDSDPLAWGGHASGYYCHARRHPLGLCFDEEMGSDFVRE